MKEPRISKSQVEEIKAARKANQNKKIEKRLQVLEMYGAGKSQKEMQESLNSTYRRLNRQRSVFPSDTALLKAVFHRRI